MKKRYGILVLLVLLLSSLVMGAPTFSGLEPDDNWKTSDKTPRFCVIIVGGESGGYSNLTLYIGDSSEGNLTATYNDNKTKACITSILTLNYTSYLWKFGVVNQTEGGYNSTARTITISMFGSAVQVMGDIAEIFAAVVGIIIGIMPLMIGIAVIGFILVLLADILRGINKKVK